MAKSKNGSVEWRVGGKAVTEEEYRKAKAPYALRKCGMAKFTRKTGKVDVVLEGTGFSLLHMWATANLSKTKDAAIWCEETGEVLFYLEGRLNDLPKDYGFKPNNIKIGDLCPELADF